MESDKKQKKIKQVRPEEIREMFDASNGHFMTVTFVKRTDGTVRTMNCRTGVKKNLKGTGPRYHNSGLYTVYDMVKKEYRKVNISGVHKIVKDGVEYRVRV